MNMTESNRGIIICEREKHGHELHSTDELQYHSFALQHGLATEFKAFEFLVDTCRRPAQT
jgi:hypothetical protein